MNITDNDSEDGNNNEDTEMVTIKPLSLTYQRGEKGMCFLPLKGKGPCLLHQKKILKKARKTSLLEIRKASIKLNKSTNSLTLTVEINMRRGLQASWSNARMLRSNTYKENFAWQCITLIIIRMKKKIVEKIEGDLGLQKNMAMHYALKNKFARAKLKGGLAKIQTLKEEKDQENFGILTEASL